MEDPGFQLEAAVLTEAECHEVTRALSSDGPRKSRAGARHLMTHPAVADLARSPGLLQIARRWVGPGAVPYRATLFSKSGEHNWLVVWHQDTALPLEAQMESPEWGPWSTKLGVHYAHAPAWALSRIVALRLHLDPSTPRNGPLRVIPGSHERGVLTDEDVFRAARMQRPIDCLSGRGGVLAMRPLLIHSSSKAEHAAPRRVLHLEYAASLDLAPRIRLAIA